jgi:bifunctional enzyme CysN/CysC
MQDPAMHVSAFAMPFKVVVVGHVDHGKSSLIGRLLYETGMLSEAKVAELEEVSAKRGMPLEWSFVLDAFQAERDQAVTIDTTQIFFKTQARPYVIIDAPGHREFLKNMVSGAAQADAAVLVVDASEGVREQTRRHAYLLRLLGLRQVVVAINKMDLVGHDRARFDAVAQEITGYLADIGQVPTQIVPISARNGDNLAALSERMPWYHGKPLLQTLDGMAQSAPPEGQPLRLAIQDVYHFDERRILAGRVESGRLSVGDTVLFSPSNKTALVASIESWNAARPLEARAGQSVGITLKEQIFVERGEMASHVEAPPRLTTVFRAHLFFLGRNPLVVGKSYKLKLATAEARVTVEKIERIIDTDTLAAKPGNEVGRNEVAEVVLRTRRILALDEFRDLPRTGRFVLIEDYDTVAGGLVSMEGYPDQRGALTVKSTNVYSVQHRVGPEQRFARNGHRGGVLWFTGLSGSGKSTLAMEIEGRLFAKGWHVYVLDGDNVRRGLNANLGFSPDDRAENIRRVGEVAALFAEAGLIVITAFISPYQADRDRARAAAEANASGAFHEIYIKAGLAACEARDPKGLYAKARQGKIAEFTGISAPYEAPVQPALTVDTERQSVDAAVAEILRYVEHAFALDSGK